MEGISPIRLALWPRRIVRNLLQVGQFAEQFSGYGQQAMHKLTSSGLNMYCEMELCRQDSMELIEYVLDGLKEAFRW